MTTDLPAERATHPAVDPAVDPDPVRAAIASMLGSKATAEDLRAIAAALEAARAAGVARDPAALAEIEAATDGIDPVFRESALALLTGNLGHYATLLAMIGNVLDLAPLDGINQIYWSMQRQLFLMRMDASSVRDFAGSVQFPFYAAFVREVARRFAVTPTTWRGETALPPRIVLVTNQFLSPLHQPSRDLLRQAALLRSRGGAEVTILNTNTMPDRYYSPFVPPFSADVETRLDGDQMLSFEDQEYRILSSTEPGLTASKVNGFIAAVNRIDPEAVVAMGSSVLIADLLAGARPCLCIPTTSGRVTSLAPIILDYGGATPPSGDDHYARAWRPFRFALSTGDRHAPMTRAECGIPEDAFVCVVVGNRLDQEVTDDFLAMLDRILAADPAVFVAFAGAVNGLPARLASRPGAARLRCLGHVDRMNGLLPVCDAYLNPRRTGGGGSAMQALAAGVPIVTMAEGDVASVGGPDSCVAGTDAFVARVRTLAGDPAERARAKVAAQERHAALVAESGDGDQLLDYIAEARKLFLARAGS